MKALLVLAVALSGCAANPVKRTVPAVAPAALPEAPAAPRPLPREPQIALDVVAVPSKVMRCPPEMVLVAGRVCVDRFEAIVRQVLDDGSTRPWSPHETPAGEITIVATAEAGVTPQGHISGAQAERACLAAGKRLCTATEWEVACRGPQRTVYPYGAARREGVCNDDGRDGHPVAEITRRFGLDPDRMWYESMNHAGINQLPGTLEPTGAHAACSNAYGALDMVGNLHEWIDDPEGTFRGGFFMDTQINGEGCEYATTAHGKDYYDYSTGFRCCRQPQPMG